MNTDEQITAIKDIMMEEVFDEDKVDRINDILNTNISPVDLSTAYERGYTDRKSNTLLEMVIYGAICGVTGGIIALVAI